MQKDSINYPLTDVLSVFMLNIFMGYILVTACMYKTKYNIDRKSKWKNEILVL